MICTEHCRLNLKNLNVNVNVDKLRKFDVHELERHHILKKINNNYPL